MEREYKFYGWKDTDIKPVNEEYAIIGNPRVLYDVLTEIWSKEGKTVDRSLATAFVTQDIFGGNVYGGVLDGGDYHCYNAVDGHVFDLTSEQLLDGALTYDTEHEQLRADHLSRKEVYDYYIFLKDELKKKMGKLKLISLLDRAIRGDVDAASEVAIAYYTGELGEKNLPKAKKWALYATKRGSKLDLERIARL